MYRGVARCAGVAVTSGTLGEGKDTRPGSHEERPLWSRNKKELSDQPTGQREPWSPSASKGSTVSWGVAEQCVRNQERGVPFERLHGGLSSERQESCSLGPAKPGEGCFSPSGLTAVHVTVHCMWDVLLIQATPGLAFTPILLERTRRGLSEAGRAQAGLLGESAAPRLPSLPSQSS